MPTYRGVLGTFEGLPSAGNADFAKGDVICATRYRRAPSQPSLSQRRASPPFRAELHPWGGDTDEHRGWRRGTQPVHRNRTLEPLAAPWGEAGDVSTRKQSAGRATSQPEPDS